MNSFKYIKCEVVEDVVSIIFNRPKYNILNIQMISEINEVIKEILNDKTLKALVFEAKGDNWCSGVEVSDHKPEFVEDMIFIFGRFFKLIHKLEIPVISAVHGACLGGGMEVAIASDIIISSKNAFFGQPEIKLGFFPPYAVVRLPHLVGKSRAIEICTIGKYYSALDAYRMGIVSEVVGDDTKKEELKTGLNEILKKIRTYSPLIIRMNKKTIVNYYGMNLINAIDNANNFFLNNLMKTSDVLEGIASFEEKRKPLWRNK